MWTFWENSRMINIIIPIVLIQRYNSRESDPRLIRKEMRGTGDLQCIILRCNQCRLRWMKLQVLTIFGVRGLYCILWTTDIRNRSGLSEFVLYPKAATVLVKGRENGQMVTAGEVLSDEPALTAISVYSHCSIAVDFLMPCQKFSGRF